MTTKHTPGPWTMIRGTLGTSQYHIAEMMPSAYPDMPPCFAPAEQQEANARLIEAAPRMYQWLTAHYALEEGPGQTDRPQYAELRSILESIG